MTFALRREREKELEKDEKKEAGKEKRLAEKETKATAGNRVHQGVS
jgi:hypothetical protein